MDDDRRWAQADRELTRRQQQRAEAHAALRNWTPFAHLDSWGSASACQTVTFPERVMAEQPFEWLGAAPVTAS
jgi:hypothetical protein